MSLRTNGRGTINIIQSTPKIHRGYILRAVFVLMMCVDRTTPYAVYSPETYKGHWRQLTVRTSRTDQTMAIVFFNPQVEPRTS